MNQTEYARHLKSVVGREVTRNSVHMAVRRGRIPPEALVGKKIDPKLADPAWLANVDATKPRNSVSGRPVGGNLSETGRNGGGKANGTAPPSPQSTLNAQQAERMGWQAKLARLEYEQKAGLVMSVTDFERQVYALNREALKALRSIPARLAGVLAGVHDPAEVERRIRKAIDAVCDQIASGEEPGAALPDAAPADPVNGGSVEMSQQRDIPA